MKKISVCVATYKRPELLLKLLNSLIIQKNIENYILEIIVVDNDNEQTARKIFNRFNSTDRLKLIYDVEPEKNISLTRNRAISQATGEFILFIDDDEYADEYWIYEHQKAVRDYNADGAFGNVIMYFSELIPRWIKGCYFFHYPVCLEGEKPLSLYKTNCCVRKLILNNIIGPFDYEYGITGGSDHKLFIELIKLGFKFISCPLSISYEFVPPDRARVKWLIKRVFRTGNNYSRVELKMAKNKILVFIREPIRGTGQSILALLLSVLTMWSFSKSLEWFLKSVSNFGKLFALIGVYPKEYK